MLQSEFPDRAVERADGVSRDAVVDYGAVASLQRGHGVQGSRGVFSRLRRRSALHDTAGDYRGDFIIHDFINEKTRSYVLESEHERARQGRWGDFKYVCKIYFVLIALGLSCGVMAAGMDLVVEWLSDLKFGLCTHGWFLAREVCCHAEFGGGECSHFRTWGQIAQATIWTGFPAPFANFVSYLSIAVGFIAVAAFLVKRFAPYAAGSGVPEIKAVLSGVVMKGYLSAWAFVVKMVGLALAVASNLNMGKEGPFVHLASVVSYLIASLFVEFRENHTMLMEFVCVGTAVGVSVAFNAPIGGVLFAFEEAASYFPNQVLWRSFFASALAALSLKLMNPYFNGRAVMFEVDHNLDWYWFEMVAFFFIGGLGGLAGTTINYFNVMWTKFRLHDPFVKRRPILEAVLLVLVTVMFSYPIPYLRLSNTQILASLFSACSELPENGESAASLICDPNRRTTTYLVLAYAALSKLILTILTFGVRVPAGLFIPALTIGACVGRVIGDITQYYAETEPDWFVFRECASTSVCVRPAIYAIVCAAATLGGVTQVSVSLVVIMFELTGGLSHLLPTMIGILAAKMVCTLFGVEGIYDMHINLKRLPFLDTKQHVSHTVPARTIMRPPRAVIPELGASIGALRQLLNDYKYYGFPIVRTEADMILTGNVVRKELDIAIRRAMEDPRVDDDTLVSFKGEFNETDNANIQRLSQNNEIVLNFAGFRDRFLSQVSPETPVSDVYDCFSALGVRMCFVTRHGSLIGLISKKDIIAYCDCVESIPTKYFL